MLITIRDAWIKLNKDIMQIAKAVLKHVLWWFVDGWTFLSAASGSLKTFTWTRELARILEDKISNDENEKIEDEEDAE